MIIQKYRSSASKREKLFYGAGGMGKDFASAMFNSYLLIFYTDVLGFAGGIAGMIIMISKTIDAVSNPIIGLMIDRTQTRWGKFRPYLLFIPIPLAVFSVLTFSSPDLGPIQLIAYALITYNLAGICFTIYDVAIMGMVPSMSNSLKDRGHFISSVRTFGQIAVLIVSTGALPMVSILGSGNEKQGYLLLMAILGGGIILSGWVAFFGTKEKKAIEIEPPKLKEYPRVIFKNKKILFLFLCVITFGLTTGSSSAANIYHVRYFLRAPELIPLYMFISNVMVVSGIILAGFFIPKRGNKKVTLYFILGTMIFSSAMFIVSYLSIPIFMILVAITHFLIGISLVSLTGMIAEMTDYLEWTTNRRSDGVLFSMLAFGLQFGSAIASGSFGFILDWSGYIANSKEQTTTALFWINAMRTLVPVVTSAMMLILIKNYPISDTNDYKKLLKNLEKQRNSNISA
ncbi:glycoside-pentoside-hexuronide (GPH):cation symporter [Priestia megaterium]